MFGAWDDLCRANGAAVELINNCDSNCCPEECYNLSPTDAYSDPSYLHRAGHGRVIRHGRDNGLGRNARHGWNDGHGRDARHGWNTGTGGPRGTGGTGGTGGSRPGSGGAGRPVARARRLDRDRRRRRPGARRDRAGRVLLQNGQFDTSTAGWTPSYGATESRSPTDAAGNAQSGSLDLGLTGGDPTLSVEVAASQCISAVGGATYDLSVEVMVPSTATSAGALGLWFFASSDCSGASPVPA